MAGTCEYGDEASGSIKCGEFLDQLQNQLASQEGLCSMEQYEILSKLKYGKRYKGLCTSGNALTQARCTVTV